MIDLRLGDCLEVLQSMEDNSVDSIVTDPPYGISMMGKKWDYDVPSKEIWEQCLRVLKPGGHLLAFAGTRTQHRMCVNIEDAGFEIRDMIAWVYGSGFPKSHNIGKAIDKAAGAEREVVGFDVDFIRRNPNNTGAHTLVTKADGTTLDGRKTLGRKNEAAGSITAPATPEAQQWDGWGTALKPALEPITVARKPFKGTVANNVLEHGTGAINIDECRVATGEDLCRVQGNNKNTPTPNAPNNGFVSVAQDQGRWPANLIHDGSDEVTELFPDRASSGEYTESLSKPELKKQIFGSEIGDDNRMKKNNYANEKGSAARFFYCAKASKADREDGNSHPTVKPTDLMAYLCRLVTPPEGTVLDPFMGSGSTGKAALREGLSFIGIERDPEYYAIAEGRVVQPRRDKQLSLTA